MASNQLIENLAPITPDSPSGYPSDGRIKVTYRVVVKPKTAPETEGGQ